MIQSLVPPILIHFSIMLTSDNDWRFGTARPPLTAGSWSFSNFILGCLFFQINVDMEILCRCKSVFKSTWSSIWHHLHRIQIPFFSFLILSDGRWWTTTLDNFIDSWYWLIYWLIQYIFSFSFSPSFFVERWKEILSDLTL